MWRLIAFFAITILVNIPSSHADDKAKHAKWLKFIQEFREADNQQTPKVGGIVFFGDSDVVLCKLEKWFPDAEALNRGFGGSHMDDVLFYLDDVLLKYKPKVAILSCGGNDITDGDSPKNIHKEFEEIVTRIFAKLPDCRLLVTAQHTPPEFTDKDDQIRQLNELLHHSASKDERIKFLTGTRAAVHDDEDRPDVKLFRRDRVHFNREGYRRWTKVIAAELE